ncbi:MAG: transposase [Candidatus Cloacimonadales bacterium]|nr:transposase [Candidatus Cloacimonadales bacterium]
MRSRYKFIDSEKAPYFLTFSVIERIPVFTNSKYCDVIIENFEFYRKERGLQIFNYVIMDNHVHAIMFHENEIGKVVQDFKKYTAKQILELLENDSRSWIKYLMKFFKKPHKTKSTYQFWQEGSHPELIQNQEMYNQKVDYIHNNPVKRGLVLESKDWYYSSARNLYGLDNPFEVDVIDDNWGMEEFDEQ